MISATVNESKNVGDSALDIASGAEPKNFTRVIFDRIATLERTRLQTQCLLALSALPVWNHLVFRGAVALHGVWLHGRCSRDLDFLAPAEIKNRFMEIVGEQGLILHEKEGARIPHFSMQGKVFKEVAVGIDVCTREFHEMTTINAVYQGGNTKIPVRVMPLPSLIAEKLRATSRRTRSTDFYDVWVFAKRFPELLPDLRCLLQVGSVDGERLGFNAQSTQEHFSKCREGWQKDLVAYMPQVPIFENVQRDLDELLKKVTTLKEF